MPYLRVEVAMVVNSIGYITPIIKFDDQAKTTVVQYRNADTGDVSFQIPSENALKRAKESGVVSASTAVAPAPTVAGAAPQPARFGGGGDAGAAPTIKIEA
jgi:hypothetical protein